MNRKKWEKPDVPMSKLGLKLAEECGETVQKLLDADEEGYTNPRTLMQLEKEAEHAAFIAGVILRRAHTMRLRLYYERRNRQ